MNGRKIQKIRDGWPPIADAIDRRAMARRLGHVSPVRLANEPVYLNPALVLPAEFAQYPDLPVFMGLCRRAETTEHSEANVAVIQFSGRTLDQGGLNKAFIQSSVVSPKPTFMDRQEIEKRALSNDGVHARFYHYAVGQLNAAEARKVDFGQAYATPQEAIQANGLFCVDAGGRRQRLVIPQPGQ